MNSRNKMKSLRSVSLTVTMCCVMPSLALCVERSVSEESIQYTLLRSGAVAGTYSSKEACLEARTARRLVDATTKTRGQARFVCREDRGVTVLYGPAPPVVCGAAPDPRVVTCPAGTSPDWTQRATVGPPPACTVTWAPLTTPLTACLMPPVEPVQLPAPTGLTATKTPNVLNINVEWQQVADAHAYSLERCIGATCTTFSQLLCQTTLSAVHIIGNQVDVRYRVRASKDVACSNAVLGNLGLYSTIVMGSTRPVNPPDPEPGVTCAAAGCTVSWTPAALQPAGVTVAGYYIVYGDTTNELIHTINVPGANVRSHLMSTVPPGRKFFAVQAYDTTGRVSVNSIMVERVVR